jgi:F-type H+-transporting ATPase subunit gamma
VTRRRDVERSLAGLREIRSILDAMRNLAVLETRKIARFRAAHGRSLDTLAAAAGEVARFHAPALRAERRLAVWILVGAERGFCGDLNEALLRAWDARSAGGTPGTVVAVGTRLASRLQGRTAAPLFIPGPSIAEDTNAVIVELAGKLRTLLQHQAGTLLELNVLHYDPEALEPELVRLEPFPGQRASSARGTPPQLNVPAEALLPELGERHLLAQLQAVLYAALAAENEKRLRHMEGAIRRLDDDSRRLKAQRNRLRQEEITEEIEVLMLSAERPRTPAQPSPDDARLA